MFAVAPSAGAWIEIFLPYVQLLAVFVAPSAGAWIEINPSASKNSVIYMSLPPRERGLKCSSASVCRSGTVAPSAGAWIEISFH